MVNSKSNQPKFKSAASKRKNRRKHKAFSVMPDWLLLALVSMSGLITAFCSHVLGEIGPSYFEIANRVPLNLWGWKGWVLTVGLATIALVAWHFGSITLRCSEILRARWYK